MMLNNDEDYLDMKDVIMDGCRQNHKVCGRLASSLTFFFCYFCTFPLVRFNIKNVTVIRFVRHTFHCSIKQIREDGVIHQQSR